VSIYNFNEGIIAKALLFSILKLLVRSKDISDSVLVYKKRKAYYLSAYFYR
jgi:hypothetical protein